MSEPLSPNTGVGVVDPKSADEIEDFLNEPDKPTDKTTGKGDKEIVEEEIKPEDEIELKGIDEEERISLEEEEEIQDEDKIQLKEEISIEAPPRKKQISSKYPKFFEEFPFMEKMLYRDKEYTEMFGSFDDAKEAAEKAEQLGAIEGQLLSGRTEEILKNVKDTDNRAFDKIVDDYLPSLARVDKEAYLMVTGNIVKRLAMEMVSEAKQSDNEDLMQAALLMNQFMFGKSKFEPIKYRTQQTEEGRPEAQQEQERREFVRERFETARDDLQSRCDNILRSTIDQYIDQRGHMTGFVKKQAVREALETLNSSLGSDPSLRRNLDKLWRSSFDEKFSKTSLSKIQSAYLGRARALLPGVIKKARAEALKDLPPRIKKEREEENTDENPTPRRGIQHAGRPSQQKKSTQMEKGESVQDFLMRD